MAEVTGGNGGAYYARVRLLVTSVDALDAKWHLDRCVTCVRG